MARRESLAAGMKRPAEAATAPHETCGRKPAKGIVETAVAADRPRYVPPSREGKKALTAWVPAAAAKQFNMMALEQDTTVQALLAELVDEFFARHGKPRLARSVDR
jgi:hypothetical protein